MRVSVQASRRGRELNPRIRLLQSRALPLGYPAGRNAPFAASAMELKGKEAHLTLRRQIACASDVLRRAQREKPFCGEVERPPSPGSTNRPTPVRKFARWMATACFFDHGVVAAKPREQKSRGQAWKMRGENQEEILGVRFHRATLRRCVYNVNRNYMESCLIYETIR
jgi:hypothetical protein